jgi:hypothetical protein
MSHQWMNHYRSRIAEIDKIHEWAQMYKEERVCDLLAEANRILMQTLLDAKDEPPAPPIVRFH